MCDKTNTLILIYIAKIIVFIILPLIFIIFNKKLKNKIINFIYIFDILLIVMFLILKLLNNDCVINSTIKNIKFTSNTINNIVYEDGDSNVVESIITNKIYKNKNNMDVYYYNNATLPLSDKKIVCDGKELYMKNAGNSITAMATILSSTFKRNIDPIEILNKSFEKGIFDCENGVDFNELLKLVNDTYSATFKNISSSDIINNINDNKVILVESDYNDKIDYNITCSKGYFIVYNITNSNKYVILNPNDRSYDYICPDNTKGVMSIIKANTNNKEYTLEELNNLGNRFMILERN